MGDKSCEKTAGDADVEDDEGERERMRKVRQKLAKKKWVVDSDDEESSSSSDEDGEDDEEKDKNNDKPSSSTKEGSGLMRLVVPKNKKSSREASPRGGEKGEEKSIEYLLKKYYSTEGLTDDLVKVGGKWMLKKDLQEQEEKLKKAKQKEEVDQKKSLSIKRLQDATAMPPLKLEGKIKEKEKDSKKDRKRVMSPPVSPRSPRSLLVFSKEKRKKNAERESTSPPSPGFGKRLNMSANQPPELSRRRAATQIARPASVDFEVMDEEQKEREKEREKDRDGIPPGKRPSSAEYASVDLEGEGKDRNGKKKERRRSMGPVQDADKILNEEGRPKKRWSDDYDEISQTKPGGINGGSGGVPTTKSMKEEGKKKRLSLKLPGATKEIGSKKSHSKSNSGGSGGSGVGSVITTTGGGAQPPPAPPPPVVMTVPDNIGGRTLARELSSIFCYSDRRDWDFRDEMLARERERKKLLELKKDIKNSEKEYQRRKKESVKDANKKAKWGLLFSLPQDVRKLKHWADGEEGGGSGISSVDNSIVESEEESEEEEEGDEDSMTNEELAQRVRLLDLRLERTISQLLLVDPEEGEKLLAQKQEEEEKRKKALEEKAKKEEADDGEIAL